eukprot:TRINITY_DN6205_c0_g1_i1.p1 TRINITY_DN6205_c0_g1~~TRINITY_DN6205_c0_g1_i1.p1  ORF type:complete len:246 (+),score=33.17 TRINITY_DN6205_c0_g1_i1:3-740(+)
MQPEDASKSVLCVVWVVRHGQGHHNLFDPNGRKLLHLFDPSLTEKGEGDAREVFGSGEGLRFSRVYVSPLRRALQTAHLALLRLSPDQPPCPLIAHEDVRETIDHFPCNHRRPLGLLREEFPTVDWSLLEEHGPAPGLEARNTHREEIMAVRERARRFLAFLSRAHSGGESVAVFSHSGWIRGLLAVVEGCDEHTYYEGLPTGAAYQIVLLRTPEGDVWRMSPDSACGLPRVRMPERFYVPRKVT